MTEKRQYEIDTKGHEWEMCEGFGGELPYVDIFAYEDGYCNGPKCVKCGYSFCHHCQTMPSTECTNERS